MNAANFLGGWHRVLVFDDGLREFVRNNLKESDRILINGEISYNNKTLDNGKQISRGWIMASRIHKLAQNKKIDEIEPQNTEKQATGEQTN